MTWDLLMWLDACDYGGEARAAWCCWVMFYQAFGVVPEC